MIDLPSGTQRGRTLTVLSLVIRNRFAPSESQNTRGRHTGPAGDGLDDVVRDLVRKPPHVFRGMPVDLAEQAALLGGGHLVDGDLGNDLAAGFPAFK